MIRIQANEYGVYGTGNPWGVKLVRVDHDRDAWAIRSDHECLNKDGSWEYEPMPSGRSDEFIARTRFTFDEANALLTKHYGNVDNVAKENT